MPILSRRRAATVPIVAMTAAALFVSGAEAQGLPRVETEFANGSKLRFYGQINKGFLSFDDGQVSESYNFIDNANSNTRFGLTYTGDLGNGWNYLGTLEIRYDPVSTSNQRLNGGTGPDANLRRSTPASEFEFQNRNIRQIDNRLSHDDYGSFFLGQGNMASQDTSGVDFSGTTVIASRAVGDSAGGQLLRREDGTLSSTNIATAFADYNGQGRRVRVRYDTPSFSGFTLRASYGQDQLSADPLRQDDPRYDIAAAYAGESGDFRYGAQIAYSWEDRTARDQLIKTLNGSGSVLHTPTGLNLTIAAGNQDNEVRTGQFFYVKGGWLGDVVDWGRTAVSIDYYSGDKVFDTGSEASSTGLAVVQNVTAWNTEFYATYRTYTASTPTTNFQDASAVFVGARFRF